MKILSTSLACFLLFCSIAFTHAQSKTEKVKCSQAILNETEKNSDKITDDQFLRFLNSLSKSCDAKSEYAADARELLLNLVFSFPRNFINLMDQYKNGLEWEFICDELKYWKKGGHNRDEIYEMIRNSRINSDVKYRIVNALDGDEN